MGDMATPLRGHEPYLRLRILRPDETLGHDTSGDNNVIHKTLFYQELPSVFSSENLMEDVRLMLDDILKASHRYLL